MSLDTSPAGGIGHLYEHLAFDLDDAAGGTSLSGYQCENPFVDDFLLAVRQRTASVDYRHYIYFDADDRLSARIRAFHHSVDAQVPPTIVCGSGSTSLLIGLASYLRGKDIRSVLYVPPLYFALRVALERFGITAVPVADRQPYEAGFHLAAPKDSHSCMLVSDPVWYSGTPLSEDVVAGIAHWQSSTHGMVCVDGSMQYMQWKARAAERTACLDPSLTIRLVCPTKQLAVHGYRFAYFVAPEREARALAWSCATVAGAASAESVAFGHEAMQALADGHIPRQLTELAAGRYGRLRRAGVLDSEVEASCGYTAFARINPPVPSGQVLLGGRYFEQANYPDYCKVNLLSPSIRLLDSQSE